MRTNNREFLKNKERNNRRKIIKDKLEIYFHELITETKRNIRSGKKSEQIFFKYE